jgi:GTP-binding protein Era
MVIGAGGERLKQIGTTARQDMERLFGGRVWLDLHVRVEKDWMTDPGALRRHGYL